MPYFIVLDPYQLYLLRVGGGGRNKMRNSEILNKLPFFWEKLRKPLPAKSWSPVMNTEICCFQETSIRLTPQIFLAVWEETNPFPLQLLISRTGNWTEFCSPTFAIRVDKSKVLAILLEQNRIDCLFKFTLFQLTVIGCYFFKKIVVWKCSAGL